MYKYLIICICLFFTTACGNSKTAKLQAKEDAKWTALMANHDAIMPMMNTTNKVRKNLKNILIGNKNLSPETNTEINTLIQNLDKADEDMMDWMNNLQHLDKLQKNKKHKEIVGYLDKQDSIIKNVGATMTNSIKKGMSFMKNFEQRQQ